MARSRSIPTNLYWDPDFSQFDSDTQSILIGLTLIADDEGRGSAHLDILARQLNKQATLIGQALEVLSTCEFITCYTVGRHRYYQHTRWEEWEHGLTPNKRTPSRYPAPPREREGASFASPKSSSPFPEHTKPSREILGIPANPKECAPQEEEKKNSSQREEEGEEKEHSNQPEEKLGEEHLASSSNLLVFPIASAVSDVQNKTDDTLTPLTSQVAQTLKIAETPALAHIVEEYRQVPDLSLLGEADMAREWIDDRQRNRTNKRMTPAFFRRWLKREQQTLQQRQTLSSSQTNASSGTGTAGATSPRLSGTAPRSSPAYRSLMHLEAEYLHVPARKEGTV